ncbi:hypothetical protein C8R44DRAFT_984435 [Mycena epipterygia]|nr:hypothetical protein C8R44DRAFT_984435 [Mycena epipterygia]
MPPVELGGASRKNKDMSQTERDFAPLERVALVSHGLDDAVTSTDFNTPLITSRQRMRLLTHLTLDRPQPPPREEVERGTDAYHIKYILEAATIIAGIMTNQSLEMSFSQFSGGITGDLKVFSKDIGDKHFITAEDKRGLVWAEHEGAFLELLRKGEFPTIKPTETPSGAVRIIVQVYVQMHIYRVFYAKIFSACGVVYVRRDAHMNHLKFSRVYHDLDDEIRRTACLIMQAIKHPLGHNASSTPSIMSIFPTIRPMRDLSIWIRRKARI